MSTFPHVMFSLHLIICNLNKHSLLEFQSFMINAINHILSSGISGDGRGELPAGQPGAAGHDRGAGGGRDCLETSGETANPSWRPHRSQHEQRNLYDWYDIYNT